MSSRDILEATVKYIATRCVEQDLYSLAVEQNDGSVVCVHQHAPSEFRMRLAEPGPLFDATLIDHLDDVYKTHPHKKQSLTFTEDEITMFEQTVGTSFSLPPLFRHYLLTISKQITKQFATTIDLTKANMSTNETVTLDMLKRDIKTGSRGILKNFKPSVYQGTVLFSSMGCGLDSHIVLNGQGAGAILTCDGNDTLFVSNVWEWLLEVRK